MAPSAFPRLAPTRESDWLRWADARPPLAFESALGLGSTLVVVSPHPDDETLACGGLIAMWRSAQRPVRVVAVTEGEGSHPAVGDIATVRRDEQRRALALLGCEETPVRLGLPDGEVAAHRDRLERRLLACSTSSDLIVAPWSYDGHTDHDVCGRAAEAIAATQGCALLEYPVWAWQWATPAELDAAGSWSTSALSPAARRAKHAAVACFPSQTTDQYGSVVVDGAAVARFERPFEVFTRVR